MIFQFSRWEDLEGQGVTCGLTFPFLLSVNPRIIADETDISLGTRLAACKPGTISSQSEIGLAWQAFRTLLISAEISNMQKVPRRIFTRGCVGRTPSY